RSSTTLIVSPLGIDSGSAAPTPTGFAEIVSGETKMLLAGHLPQVHPAACTPWFQVCNVRRLRGLALFRAGFLRFQSVILPSLILRPEFRRIEQRVSNPWGGWSSPPGRAPSEKAVFIGKNSDFYSFSPPTHSNVYQLISTAILLVFTATIWQRLGLRQRKIRVRKYSDSNRP